MSNAEEQKAASGTETSEAPLVPEEPRTIDLARWNIQLYTWEQAHDLLRACTAAKRHGHLVTEEYRHGPSVRQVQDRVESVVDALRVHTDKQRFGLRLLLEEAFVNGIRRRNRKGEHVEGEFQPAWAHYGVVELPDEQGEPASELVVMIEDEGKAFDPRHVPNCLHPDYLERGHGRGVMLMGYYASVSDNHLAGKSGFLPIVPEAAADPFFSREYMLRLPLAGREKNPAQPPEWRFAEWLKQHPAPTFFEEPTPIGHGLGAVKVKTPAK